jgi:hypothetical protein
VTAACTWINKLNEGFERNLIINTVIDRGEKRKTSTGNCFNSFSAEAYINLDHTCALCDLPMNCW